MIQLTSPNGIRAAKLPYGQTLAWDLENLGKEINRVSKNGAASSGTADITTGAFSRSIRTTNASTLVTDSDFTILADATAGAITITLPSGVKGRLLNLSKIDATSNAMILSGNGRTINGSATVSITTPDVNLQIQFSGSEWRVL